MNAPNTQGQDAQVKDPSFRPRFSKKLAANIKRAAALRGLTVPAYLEQHIGPFVSADLRGLVIEAADSLNI
jgi:hypothetical protein